LLCLLPSFSFLISEIYSENLGRNSSPTNVILSLILKWEEWTGTFFKFEQKVFSELRVDILVGELLDIKEQFVLGQVWWVRLLWYAPSQTVLKVFKPANYDVKTISDIQLGVVFPNCTLVRITWLLQSK
jgi:hypothetical protein